MKTTRISAATFKGMQYKGVIQVNQPYNKFKNQITEYGGKKYHSKKEAMYAAELDMLANARFDSSRVVKYETQVKYHLDVNGHRIGAYILDFKVWYGDGRIEYVDVKGVVTQVYAMKRKLMKAIYDIDIKEV